MKIVASPRDRAIIANALLAAEGLLTTEEAKARVEAILEGRPVPPPARG